MTTSQTRVSRGIPAGGQFASTVHAEPTLTLAPGTDPQAQANLNRPRAVIELTEEQAANLRRPKTPIANTAARRGTGPVTVDLTATNNHIRDIQARLQGR